MTTKPIEEAIFVIKHYINTLYPNVTLPEITTYEQAKNLFDRAINSLNNKT